MAIALGVAVGAAYGAFDVFVDDQLHAGHINFATTVGHTIFDVVVPIVIGGLIAATVQQLGLRKRLADSERLRAEALQLHLKHIEPTTTLRGWSRLRRST